MFQAKFGKVDEFSWWELETISADASTKFTPTEFRMNVKPVVFSLP